VGGTLLVLVLLVNLFGVPRPHSKQTFLTPLTLMAPDAVSFQVREVLNVDFRNKED